MASSDVVSRERNKIWERGRGMIYSKKWSSATCDSSGYFMGVSCCLHPSCVAIKIFRLLDVSSF